MFKHGDNITVIAKNYNLTEGGNVNETGTIECLYAPNYAWGGIVGPLWMFKLPSGVIKYSFEKDLKLTTNIMNLKENFALLLTKEPMKSFRKAGITNGDNILTDDGVKIFLSWVLEKHQDAFKAEVVDLLLAEQEKDCK